MKHRIPLTVAFALFAAAPALGQTAPAPDSSPASFPWGVIGAIGLVGLLGARKRAS
jgi:MYXO-CTERM domain-containing protein